MPISYPYQFADEMEPELKKLYLRIVKEAKGRIPMRELAQALARGNEAEAVAIIEKAAAAVDPLTAAKWKAAIQEVFGKTALTVASNIGRIFSFSFNLFDPGVLGAIDQMVANRVQAPLGTQAQIREIVRSGWVETINPPDQARMMRSLLTVTPQHARHAKNYYFSMIDSGINEKLAMHNFELYNDRLLNWRADTVARTENIRAANAGRVATWGQMIRDGILEEDRVVLKWFTTDDEKLCPYCAPMHGKEIPWGGEFVTTQYGYDDGRPRPQYRSLKPTGRVRDKEGKFAVAKIDTRDLDPVEDEKKIKRVPYPPLHPNCRCDVRLILK